LIDVARVARSASCGAISESGTRRMVTAAACAACEEPDMEPTGLDMGDYQERYKEFDIEVAVEQVLAGVKAHFRVLKGGVVALDWRLVHIDGFWSTERAAAQAALRAAREAIDDGQANTGN
jgi:hypothetical protein